MDRQLKLAYIAGVVDSDGWIIMAKTDSNSFRITLGISQITSEAMDLAIELFGGLLKITNKNDKQRYSSKPMYVWIMSSKAAVKPLKDLLPYLRIKKQQALLALQYQSEIVERVQRRGKAALSEETQEHRALMFLAMKSLNHRAVAETKREGLEYDNIQVSDSPICMDDKHAEIGRNDLSA